VYSEPAGLLFVSVNMYGLRNFLEQSKFYTLTAFGHLKSCWGGYHINHACPLKNQYDACKGSYTLLHGKRYLNGSH